MKRQVRKGVFETNSSSTHAICIATEDVLNIPKSIDFGFGEFGWECRVRNTMQDRANYLYTAIGHVSKTFDELHKYLTFIYETLSKNGVEDIYMDNYEIYVSNWNDKVEIMPSVDFNKGYIDHGGEAEDFVKAVCSDEDTLLHYLFSDKSYVETGNDNDDEDVDIHVDYSHKEFYKWN